MLRETAFCPTGSRAIHSSRNVRTGFLAICGSLVYPTPDPAAIEAAIKEFDLAKVMELSDPGMFRKFLVIVLATLLVIGVNYKLLRHGQTIGKKLLNIRIVSRSTSEPLPLLELIGKRIAPFYIPIRWSWYGPILIVISSLCIFRTGKNTLIDDLAGTKVVRI